jgi:hypothetical protein
MNWADRQTIGGVTMSSVSVLQGRDVRPKAVDQDTRGQDDAQSDCKLVNLLSYLEQDNRRLWQVVRDLSIETAALRQALKTMESRQRAEVPPRARRPRRFRLTGGGTGATETELLVLPFGR